MSTTTPHALSASTDPVVVYDIMVEARNRALGRYAAVHRDDWAAIVKYTIALDKRIKGVALDDLEAQRALTAQLKAETENIRA